MKETLHKIAYFLVRELRYILWILTLGGGMVLLSVLMLVVQESWEEYSQVLAAVGTKILFLGYPVFVLLRILRRIFFPKRKTL